MSKENTIIFIPPNGEIFINDFTIQRICKDLKKFKNIKTILLKIDKVRGYEKSFDYVDLVIDVNTQKDIIEKINEIKPKLIFHRSWMHAYPFAARLVKNFDNVIVNIKDWNFSSKKEYEIIFDKNATKDFKAIKYIFKNAKKVLSHYTKEQAKIWSKKYKVSKNKFIFFPEYCNKENFIDNLTPYNKKKKLVFAGTFAPSSYPQETFVTKYKISALRKITSKNISVTIFLPEGAYNSMFSDDKRILFQDFLYENEFNTFFTIRKGEILNPNILKDYHFGFLVLKYSTKKRELNKFAIPSKFAFYLEAGLPIIINDKMKSLAKIVKKYNLGIVIQNRDLENINNILEISEKEYKRKVKAIKKFRKKFTLENSKFKKVLDEISSS